MNVAELVRTFDEKRWKKLGHWKKSFMLDWIEATSLSTDSFMRVGLNWHIDNYCFVAHAAMMAEDDFLSTKQFYEGELTIDQDFAFNHGRKCYESGEALLEFSETLSTASDWSQVPDCELTQSFNTFISLVSKNIPFFPPLVALEQVLDDHLRLLLAEHLERKKISSLRLFDFMTTFSVPKRVPDMIAKRESLLHIGQRIQSDKDAQELFSKRNVLSLIQVLPHMRSDIWEALQRYTHDFGWLTTFGWLGTPSDESNALEELKDYLNSDCEGRLRSLRIDREASELAIKTALSDLDASNSLKHLIEVIREYAYLRAFRIDIYNKAFFGALPLFREIARRLAVSLEQLLFLSPPEVLSCLQSGCSGNSEVVSERQSGFAILTLDGDTSVLAGDDYELFERFHQKEEYSHLDSVTGDPVVKGLVEGPVRVVMDASDLPKVNEGDVLVAPMTNPDFTAVFGKIAGIITDEGGVLCHAAIVAREYKLPCIISTRVSTKVFRDGDFVILDATSGKASKTSKPFSLTRKVDVPLRSESFILRVADFNTDAHLGRRFISWITDDSNDALSEVGSKFRNLSILHKHGFLVPPAFCVHANAFALFLKENSLADKINQVLCALDFAKSEQIRESSAYIRTLIVNGEVPILLSELVEQALQELGTLSVSVRSSSSAEDLQLASFAGVYESYLNISGIQHVLQTAKACWASLFSERALFYHYRQVKEGLHPATVIGMAVIVQELIEAEKSGICFTANPESSRNDEIVVQAAYGLGEGAVSGEVASDVYIVTKSSLKVLKSTSAKTYTAVVSDPVGGVKTIHVESPHSSILTSEELSEVARVSSSIETVFGSPQDIEWCKDRVGTLFVLQSRPITTIRSDVV